MRTLNEHARSIEVFSADCPLYDGVPEPDEIGFLRQYVLRLDDGVRRGRLVRLTFDGQLLEAFEGETIAAALAASDERVLRRTSGCKSPRGVFCGMGACFDCLVQVDGRPNVQACVTPVREGMRIETQRGAGTWEWEESEP